MTPRRPARTRDDRGSLTVFFMLVVLAFFVCTGLAIDGGRMLAAHGQTSFASSAAASAAVAAPVPSEADGWATISAQHNGVSLIGLAPGPAGGWCATTSVTRKTWILGIIGIDTFTARTTACSTAAPNP